MTKTDIVQLAYLVKPGGMNSALDFWINVLGAGPFFRGVFPLQDEIHKGKPTNLEMIVALGYHGDVQIELIEPTNDAQGPYNDFLATHPTPPVGGSYHHIMLGGEESYDALVKRLIDGGAKIAYQARNSMGHRFCYLESDDILAPYIEALDAPQWWPEFSDRMRKARSEWRGERPVRDFGELFGDDSAQISRDHTSVLQID
ncbi:hypothetical protein BV98_001266 [Sphingobium herbicidovorans NBRC 16415]|uniref:VOC domain-containing protein n=2 Tax=Sphingobium herbicidovorans TaxID=76947 RepID=A0A086PBY1_SPHHM|nr:VOC family protein [Sphingobium herbicidovorans]KFG90899.1 hypothetical protein BV98_001266 [Sphingobium herbicidovorans NBRC 16415]